MTNKVGIVTVTYNSGKVLEDFMASILKQSHDNYVLYVIDNDSKDNTLEFLAQYKNDKIKIIANKENYGVAKGNNQGIIAATADDCDYVLLLNNDTVFDENLVSILLKDLLESNADMIAPKIMYYEPKNVIWCAGGGFKKWWSATVNYHHGDKEIDNGQYDLIKKCDYVPTCCVLVNDKLFKNNSVGLMDEKYFVYFDDTDWMWRAKCANKVLLYTPNTVLYHKVSSLTGEMSEFSIKMYFRNSIYFRRKHFKNITKFYSISFFIAIALIKLCINKISFKYIFAVFKAIKDGFCLK